MCRHCKSVTLGFFSLLNVLLLLLKKNIIFSAFSGKHEWKLWHNFMWFVVKYFSWTLHCNFFLYQYLQYCLLSFNQRIFHYLRRRFQSFTGRAEKLLKIFLSKVFKLWTIFRSQFHYFFTFFDLLNYELINC